jgi:hypothetical protein
MIAPLAPTLPHWGQGRIAMPQYYLNGKFLNDCVEEIRHNRNRGFHSGGGRIPESVISIQRISAEPIFLYF